jgi:tetratricopeptide (TPR) repeat protein
MLGAIDARSGNCAGAVENYAKAPNSINRNAAALRQYGGCLLAVDKSAEAVPILTQLLSLKEDSASRVALAQAQSKAGDAKAALATLKPLLDSGASDSSALLLAAQLEEASDNTPQAVAWLRRSIEVDPRNVDAYLFFSELSFNHGSFKVGIDFLNLGLGQLPKEARLYLARGVLEVQMSQMEKALSDFEEAHRLDPKLSFATDAQGMLFSQKHDSAAALAIFEQQSKLHPNDAMVQYLYAEALSEAGESRNTLEKALEAAKRAVRLEPGYQAARDLLCVLLLRHNDFNAVVEQAEEALRRDPYDEVALYQELLAESKLKHTERTQALVKRLQAVKTHNQQAKTKYLLQEGEPSSSASK